MKDLFRYLGRLAKRGRPPAKEPLRESPDLPHVSGCIDFFWDSHTGDFNVILNVDEHTEMSSEVLGMLMCYISEGHMSQFLVESLKYWCDSPDKMEFYTNVLKTWNIMRELQEADRLDLEEKPVVNPSDVFRFGGSENGN